MRRHKSPEFLLIWAFILLAMFILPWVGVIMSIDFSGPILSEMNPNGTVDYWYPFDNASEGGR